MKIDLQREEVNLPSCETTWQTLHQPASLVGINIHTLR